MHRHEKEGFFGSLGLSGLQDGILCDFQGIALDGRLDPCYSCRTINEGF